MICWRPEDAHPAQPALHRHPTRDLHTAHFLTCVHDRFLFTGLAHLVDTPPLQAASRAYNIALETSAAQHYSPLDANHLTQ